jgi:hypothetical protein
MKKIYRINLILLFCAGIFSSCSMAKLDKYPGTKLDSIPAAFRGNFYFKLGTTSKDPKDSVYLEISSTGWKQVEHRRTDDYTLSDDVVCSKVGKYLVLSGKDDNVKKYWNSWIILPKKKDLEIYPIVTIKNPGSDILSHYLTQQFEGMNGKDSIYYYEMNDDAFVRYFEKEIKGSKTFEVIRIIDRK